LLSSVNLLSAEAWRDGARLACGDSAAHETPYVVGSRRAGAFGELSRKAAGLSRVGPARADTDTATAI